MHRDADPLSALQHGRRMLKNLGKLRRGGGVLLVTLHTVKPVAVFCHQLLKLEWLHVDVWVGLPAPYEKH